MDLTDRLISDFVKATAPKEERASSEFTAQGVVEYVYDNNTVAVRLDGSVDTTPCTKGSSAKIGDRVIVTIKDRQATVTSNLSNPSTAQGQYNIFLLDRSVDPPETNEVCFVKVYYQDPPVMAEAAEIFPREDANPRHRVMMIDIWPETILLRGYVQAYDDVSITGDLYARSFTPTSDVREKDWIADTKINDALETINKIRHREFYWKSDNAFVPIGYVAQELESVDPNMVVCARDGKYGYNSTYVQALMSKAIQELSAKVDDLERRLADVEAEHNSVSTEE